MCESIPQEDFALGDLLALSFLRPDFLEEGAADRVPGSPEEEEEEEEEEGLPSVEERSIWWLRKVQPTHSWRSRINARPTSLR